MPGVIVVDGCTAGPFFQHLIGLAQIIVVGVGGDRGRSGRVGHFHQPIPGVPDVLLLDGFVAGRGTLGHVPRRIVDGCNPNAARVGGQTGKFVRQIVGAVLIQRGGAAGFFTVVGPVAQRIAPKSSRS